MTFRELKQSDEKIFNDWIKSWTTESVIVSVAKPITGSFTKHLSAT
ncbi:hypothetical protein NX809_04630 [Leuconostoc mesenteroides]|nr:hypothetical protein [Leuconostoc mesenteroides]UVV93438.1 hypothetical protein NX809_04630 [Leuconostoc mesenteroides]